MMKFLSFRMLLIAIILVMGSHIAIAQDQIERIWYNQEKTSKIQVYKAKDGNFYGKIVWLKDPMKDGKPKLDEENPDKNKRNQPIVGLIILKGLKKQGDKEYGDANIYDPKNGKTYSCKITYKGNTLDLRGYVGISLLGRTSTWTLSE